MYATPQDLAATTEALKFFNWAYKSGTKMAADLDYVPLTALGGAAFRLGLHRRLQEMIPESAAAKFRTWRKAFYARKFQLEPEV